MRREILEDPVDHLATSIRVSLSFESPENRSSNVTTENLRLIGLIDCAGYGHQDVKAVERLPQTPRNEALVETLEHAVSGLRHGESFPLAPVHVVVPRGALPGGAPVPDVVVLTPVLLLVDSP